MFRNSFLLMIAIFVWMAHSACAEDRDISGKQFPEAAEPYIRPCYKEAQKYWDSGNISGGSVFYQECLTKQIDKLTKGYFYEGDKKQKEFMAQLALSAQSYERMYEDIFLENKWCGNPKTFTRYCGNIDAEFSYGYVNKFYEKILIAVTETIKNKQ